MTEQEVNWVVKGLSERMRQMLLASGPDDVTGDAGVGVDLRTAADYSIAKALARRRLGYVDGPGSELCGMYWSNRRGLAIRNHLQNGPSQ